MFQKIIPKFFHGSGASVHYKQAWSLHRLLKRWSLETITSRDRASNVPDFTGTLFLTVMADYIMSSRSFFGLFSTKAHREMMTKYGPLWQGWFDDIALWNKMQNQLKDGPVQFYVWETKLAKSCHCKNTGEQMRSSLFGEGISNGRR